MGNNAPALWYDGAFRLFAGTSTSEKPTDRVITGSIFVEVDTGNVYFFNANESAWVYQFCFQKLTEKEGAKNG